MPWLRSLFAVTAARWARRCPPRGGDQQWPHNAARIEAERRLRRLNATRRRCFGKKEAAKGYG
ncbi:hypothetical protein EYF80_067367 [Liparis tanakae]|uniref:Uncharacterized protein n=1 Tax=Liparis tanakae TaxID=230148 RepID=A0A4Z2E191_9TELE|nr:hypothetical protein EYF80_067367 [Liparis tanakae]